MKFKPYEAIEVTRWGASVKGTNLQIETLLAELGRGQDVDDIAHDYNTKSVFLFAALKELSNNLIAETPMKLSLTIETPKGPVTVEDFAYGTPQLADMVKLTTALWTKIMARTELSPYSFWIKEIGPKKIQMIKLMRELTGQGLKEAKELVESAPFLFPLDKVTAKQEFTDIARKLDAAGAVYELLGKNETDVHKVMHQ